MKRVITLTESDIRRFVINALTSINEAVYANAVDRKAKKANLAYAKGRDRYLKNNLMTNDKLGTEDMDKNNSQCIKIPLKGGITSYNITDINGTEVMHFFKNYVDKIKTIAKLDVSRPMLDNNKNKTLEILWLDDKRNPREYLMTKNDSGTSIKNHIFYSELTSKYNPSFVWVKSYETFCYYIEHNGIPQFMSLDYDLDAGTPNGGECAKWLVNFCESQGLRVPNYFIHSANKNAYTIYPEILGKPAAEPKNWEKDASFELVMADNEYNEFMNQFKTKIEYVVKSYVNNMPNKDEITGISIYPVPSSRSFNKYMAKELSGLTILGLKVNNIDENLFLKDLRKLEKDEEFITKNKEYFDKPYYKSGDSKSLSTYVDNNINKYRALSYSQQNVDKANNLVKQLLTAWNNIKTGLKQGKINKNSRIVQSFVSRYIDYCNIVDNISKSSEYYNIISDTNSTLSKDTIYKTRKYTKGASVDKRSDEIYDFVKPYIRGKALKKHDIVYLDKTLFQIKNLSNGERLGLKNIYNPNTDMDYVKNEVEKIKNTIFIIFDDNISGGATLSDVCYQAKQIGIDNILPITFGKMAKKTIINQKPLNQSENDVFNF